jgi:hypothetical protein
MPYADGIKEQLEYGRFGFESLEKLKKWFPKKDRRLLKKSDFEVVVYRVKKKHVRLGGKQVVFDYRSAKPVRKSRVLKEKLKRG